MLREMLLNLNPGAKQPRRAGSAHSGPDLYFLIFFMNDTTFLCLRVIFSYLLYLAIVRVEVTAGQHAVEVYLLIQDIDLVA